MGNEIIIGARKSWFEKSKDCVLAWSPQVKAALISVGAALIISAIGNIVTLTENSRLRQELSQKTAKIQEVETELTPFRTIALQQFQKADAEALKRVAESLNDLRHRLDLAEKALQPQPFRERLREFLQKFDPTILSELQSPGKVYVIRSGYTQQDKLSDLLRFSSEPEATNYMQILNAGSATTQGGPQGFQQSYQIVINTNVLAK